MKTTGIAALAAVACTLAACTPDQTQPPRSASESGYLEVEFDFGETDETPDPNTTLHRAILEGAVDGQPVTIIEFTKSCTRSGDGNEVSVHAETRGYGYEDYNSGAGVGSFNIELIGLRDATPTVKRVNISQSTGPGTTVMVYVANNIDGEGNTGTATATSEAPDTYAITGSAPDPFDPAQTTTFTAQVTCLQPPAPAQ